MPRTAAVGGAQGEESGESGAGASLGCRRTLRRLASRVLVYLDCWLEGPLRHPPIEFCFLEGESHQQEEPWAARGEVGRLQGFLGRGLSRELSGLEGPGRPPVPNLQARPGLTSGCGQLSLMLLGTDSRLFGCL